MAALGTDDGARTGMQVGEAERARVGGGEREREREHERERDGGEEGDTEQPRASRTVAAQGTVYVTGFPDPPCVVN